jgi:single stranded DNA-binding protein
MATVNKVILIGNVGSVDVKEFDNGGKIVNLSIATSEGYKKDGEWVNITEWHRCSSGIPSIVERASKVSKGDVLYIEGSLKTRKWTSKEGEERETKEVNFVSMRTITKRDAISNDFDENQTTTKKKTTKKKAAVETVSDDLPF